MSKNFFKSLAFLFSFIFLVSNAVQAASDNLIITVSNSSKSDRMAETIEIEWQKLKKLNDLNLIIWTQLNYSKYLYFYCQIDKILSGRIFVRDAT